MDINDLLSPTAYNDFLANVWKKRYLHIAGNDEKVSGYFNWDDLNDILSHHRLEPPRLRLEKQGSHPTEFDNFIQFQTARRGNTIPHLNVANLNDHLINGATLIIDAVNEINDNIRKTCEELGKLFYTKPQANVYASWGEDEGFGTHWDDHDVFIIHLHGKKKWQLFGETRKHPLYRDIDNGNLPESGECDEFVVKTGDVLYIPRGHWHNVVGCGEPTMHITIGVTSPTGIDLLTWMVDELRSEEGLREDLPVLLKKEEGNNKYAQIKQLVYSWLEKPRFSEFLDSRCSSTTGYIVTSFPNAAQSSSIFAGSDELHFSGLLPGVLQRDEAHSEIVLSCGGKEYRFSLEAELLISDIINSTNSYSQIISLHEQYFSKEQINALLHELLINNLINIVKPK